MHLIAHSDVRQWSKVNKFTVAASIALNCPHCGEKVTIVFGNRSHDQKRDTFASTGTCPSCKGKVHSWTFNTASFTQGTPNCIVAVYPQPRTPRAVIGGCDQLPDAVTGEYKRTIDSYNNGSWLEVGVRARRTLEALTKQLLSEEELGNSLFANLQKLPNCTDLAKPIKDLSDTLRRGGNFSAHFGGEAEPTQETAEAVVDLVEAMLEYLFIVPAQSDALSKHIEELQTSRNDG